MPDDVQLPPKFMIRVLSQEVAASKPPIPGQISLPPNDVLPIPSTYQARLSANDRMTPASHWQDVRKLFLDVKCPRDAFPNFAAGATAIIYPKNYPDDVQTLIDLMGWQPVADIPLHLNSIPAQLFLKKGGSTLRDLLTHNLDITSVPKRSFIRQLEFFTREEREKERLRELTASGNEQDLYDYTTRPRRTIIEFLRDFPGLTIPYEWALELFPIIRGREFSVCNGGENLKGQPGSTLRIEILVALVEYRTIIRKPRQGLCSRYLRHLPVGTELAVGFKNPPSRVLDPSQGQHQRPLIAVATGTGIAPIRALVQDRIAFTTPPPGPVLLFFGCRNKAADYFYDREWDALPGMKVIPAFSRDPVEPSEAAALLHPRQPDGLPTAPKGDKSSAVQPIAESTDVVAFDYDAGKNYVQHRIRQYAAKVGQMMRQRPIVCVCGNAGRMPISVRGALLDALVLSGVVETRDMAEAWLQDGRNVTYWQETW